jgi:hypothetical protein
LPLIPSKYFKRESQPITEKPTYLFFQEFFSEFFERIETLRKEGVTKLMKTRGLVDLFSILKEIGFPGVNQVPFVFSKKEMFLF